MDTDRHLPAHVCVDVGSSSEGLEVRAVVKVFILPSRPTLESRQTQTREMQVEPRLGSSPRSQYYKQCVGPHRQIPAICQDWEQMQSWMKKQNIPMDRNRCI